MLEVCPRSLSQKRSHSRRNSVIVSCLFVSILWRIFEKHALLHLHAIFFSKMANDEFLLLICEVQFFEEKKRARLKN